MNTETIKIDEGQTCKIDCGSHGMNIDGPAMIVVVKAEQLQLIDLNDKERLSDDVCSTYPTLDEVSQKLKGTGLKLLDCAEKAAEKAAARCNTGDLQNVQEVVDSALRLLEFNKHYR